MNLNPLTQRWAALPGRIRGLFNLNDPRWGRGEDKPAGDGNKPDAGQQQPQNQRPQGPNQGPPDLDELWRDFNRKLGGLFGGRKQGGRGGAGGGGSNGGGGGFQPDMKSAGIGVGLVAAVAVLIWLGTGFYIVQEGQQAVITRFGKFKGPERGITGAGFNWRLPYPIERHEVVRVSQLRSVEVGRSSVAQNTGLRDSSMLTQDENIVDVRFVVQYRLKDSAEYLFNNVDPDQAVSQAAESAIREVVGKATMNTVLNEKREAIAGDIVKSTQAQLDLYRTGIIISSVNIQNVQPPEQVQAAFDDALKAGQDGDRAKNEGQAYANDILPRVEGAAARLKEESEGYKARVIAQAEGDAQRFRLVLGEYQKAPQVTRDRMYLDTMQQIYSNVTKVLVDSKQGNNLLYLPLDKIIQMTAAGTAADSAAASAASAASIPSGSAVAPVIPIPDTRARDTGRSRDRDGR
jgi:membrane protease subunit HflK